MIKYCPNCNSNDFTLKQPADLPIYQCKKCQLEFDSTGRWQTLKRLVFPGNFDLHIVDLDHPEWHEQYDDEINFSTGD